MQVSSSHRFHIKYFSEKSSILSLCTMSDCNLKPMPIGCFENLGNLILKELKLIRNDMKAEVRRLGEEMKLFHVTKHDNTRDFGLTYLQSAFFNVSDVNDEDSFLNQQNQQKEINEITTINNIPTTIAESSDLVYDVKKEKEILKNTESNASISFKVDSNHASFVEEADKTRDKNVDSFCDDSSASSEDKNELASILHEQENTFTGQKDSDRNNSRACTSEEGDGHLYVQINQDNDAFNEKKVFPSRVVQLELDGDKAELKCENCMKTFEFSREYQSHRCAFMCSLGKKLLKTKRHSHLKRHHRTHTGERTFVCKVCSKCFPAPSVLRKHEMLHRNMKPLVCEICDKRFTQRRILTAHLRSHTSEKPFECEFCDKRFAKPSTLRQHELLHKDIKPHVCNYCGKGFVYKGNLTVHIRSHTGEKPFECEFCDKRFSQSSTLRQHEMLHKDIKPHVCSYCGKGFVYKGDLTVHIRSHTGEKPFECEFCDKRFSQPSTLRQHKLLHKDIKPHVCNYCGKGFVYKGDLTVHIRSHTGEKPFECEFCDKRFSQSSTLRQHEMLHKDIKPHVCSYCGKGFPKKSYLTVHIRSHTGEKPFECEFCDKRFSQKCNLKHHVARYHEKV